MKVEHTKKGDKKIEFKVSGIDFTLANAIRRSVLAYVPAMAVDKVTVYENTTPLYEEMIAQRIGLIPLVTDLKTYSLKDGCECKGEGCGRCEVSLVLEKNGPGYIYSGDIKSRDPKITPVYDKIPLVKARGDQKIKMEMTAKLGFLTEHSKFQAGIASYKQLNDTDFEFFVESYNNMSAMDLLEVGISRLDERAKELEESILAKLK